MKTSKELLALNDLAGWRVRNCYWAQLKHGLWGTFPALFSRDGDKKVEWQPFVCESKILLGEILKMMTPRSFTITESLCLLRTRGDPIAFQFEAMLQRIEIDKETKSVLVVGQSELGQPKHFKWTPGLIGDDMSPIEFEETMRVALAKIG